MVTPLPERDYSFTIAMSTFLTLVQTKAVYIFDSRAKQIHVYPFHSHGNKNYIYVFDLKLRSQAYNYYNMVTFLWIVQVSHY